MASLASRLLWNTQLSCFSLNSLDISDVSNLWIHPFCFFYAHVYFLFFICDEKLINKVAKIAQIWLLFLFHLSAFFAPFISQYFFTRCHHFPSSFCKILGFFRFLAFLILLSLCSKGVVLSCGGGHFYISEPMWIYYRKDFCRVLKLSFAFILFFDELITLFILITLITLFNLYI